MNDYKKGDIDVNIDYATWIRDSDKVVEGKTGNDNIIIASNYDTVNAGAGKDKITIWTGSHNAVVYGEAGDDFIRNEIAAGSNSSLYGGKGNDTIRLRSSADSDYAIFSVYADGGDGDDLIIPLYLTDSTLSGGNGDDTFWFIESSAVTVTGGSGKDTYRIDPYYLYGPYHNNILITDISEEDVIRNDYSSSDGSELNWYTNSNGNVVLEDEDYKLFSITLQGVTDISQIANLPYQAAKKTTTIGDLFSVNGGGSDDTDKGGGGGDDTNKGGGGGDDTNKGGGGDDGGDDYIIKPDLPTVSADAYVYSGGNATLSATESYYSSVKGGYTTYDQVNFTTDLLSFGISGDNISINSSAGTLTLTNTRGKYLTYADGNGNAFAYSYIGVNGTNTNTSVSNSYSTVNNSYNTINDKSRTVYGVVIGGDNLNDSIIAGSGGSSLWGGSGSGGNDTLVGGAGVDEFVYKLGNGNDVIQGATSSDVVNLEGIKLSQITSIDTSAGVSAKFSDGGSIKITGTESVGIKVDGWTVAYNHSSGSWQVK